MNIKELTQLCTGLCNIFKNNTEKHNEPQNIFDFMHPLQYYSSWNSKPNLKYHISVNDNFLTFDNADEKTILQINDLVESVYSDNNPYLKNVILCDQEQGDIIIIQRFGDSTFYISDNNIPEDAAEKGLLQEIDILNFTEEQYFQLNVLYEMPPIEEFYKLQKYYPDLQEMSSKNQIDLTIVWNEIKDLDNVPNIDKEDFNGYRFE